MKLALNALQVVEFLQQFRAHISVPSVTLSDLELELIDIKITCFEEQYFYKMEREIEPVFDGDERKKVMEVWLYRKYTTEGGQEGFDISLFESSDL